MDQIPEELKEEILQVAQALGPKQIYEGLQDIIARERFIILQGGLNEETHEVIMHGLAVLTAAAAGYEQAIRLAAEQTKKL